MSQRTLCWCPESSALTNAILSISRIRHSSLFKARRRRQVSSKERQYQESVMTKIKLHLTTSEFLCYLKRLLTSLGISSGSLIGFTVFLSLSLANCLDANLKIEMPNNSDRSRSPHPLPCGFGCATLGQDMPSPLRQGHTVG